MKPLGSGGQVSISALSIQLRSVALLPSKREIISPQLNLFFIAWRLVQSFAKHF